MKDTGTTIDLTLPIPPDAANVDIWNITQEDGVCYEARVYDFDHNSMVGTYIDMPGHILGTDDGYDAASLPLDRLFRVPAGVIHLARESGSGAVTAAELQAAAPDLAGRQALVINALGEQRFDQIENRSVWLGDDALDWLTGLGLRLLVSDIYESQGLHGVFSRLFSAGINTVCFPIDLHRLTTPYVLVTCLKPRFEQVTQLPCRLLAEPLD